MVSRWYFYALVRNTFTKEIAANWARGVWYSPTPILTIKWSGIVDIPTYHVTGMNTFPL